MVKKTLSGFLFRTGPSLNSVKWKARMILITTGYV